MKHLLLSVTLFTFLSHCYSYDIKEGERSITVFSDTEGFNQNTINDICSDINNTLWLATPNGLIAYDGYDFKNYYHNETTNSIPSNIINKVFSDSRGYLWVSTCGGLCTYDIINEHFSLRNHINAIHTITEDKEGNIWVAYNNLVDIYAPIDNDDYTKIHNVTISENTDNEIIGIVVLENNEIIIYTKDEMISVSKAEDKTYTLSPIELDDKIASSNIKDVEIDGNFIWLGTQKGLFQTALDNNRLITVSHYTLSSWAKDKKHIRVQNIYIDNEDKLWIATLRSGAFMYNKKNQVFSSYSNTPKNASKLSSEIINNFCEDVFDVIWIATAQGGLNKIDKNEKAFYSYSHNDYDETSLSGNLVNSIYEDENSHIWLSFHNSPLCKTKQNINQTELNELEFETINLNIKDFERMDIIAIFQDSKGWFWLGSHSDIIVYNEKLNLSYVAKFECNNKPINTYATRAFYQVDDETILIAGDKAILVHKPWDALNKQIPINVNTDYVTFGRSRSAVDITVDDYDNFWFATKEGIITLKIDSNYNINQTNLINYKDDSIGLNKTSILSLHKDLEGNIWAGTYGKGLAKIELNKNGTLNNISTYNRESGLSDEMIYGILEDKDSILWLSTDMGICKFDPKNNKFNIYDINDGLPNNNFRRGAYCQSQSGVILMGGLKGLCVFKPENIQSNHIYPLVSISKLKVNNTDIKPNRPYNGKIILEQSITNTKELTLDFNSRNFSLEIITQHSASPEKNKLSYMLEGIDEGWITSQKGKVLANYTNLPAGEFVFRYKGANGDGLWTKEEKYIIIKVLAPWYKRWWSISLFIIIVLTIVFFILNYYLKVAKLKQSLQLEKLDKERIHEVDQAKLRFFTNISHEFKTPLSLIMAPLEKIIEESKNEQNKKYISIIQSNIHRLQRLIDNLITYRKAENGKMTTHYSLTTMGDFIYPLLEAFEENMNSKNISFTYNVSSPGENIVIDEEKTELILFNLLSNAIKFTPKDGKINLDAQFEISRGQEMLTFTVSDNGTGISPKELDKIFDRFYCTEETENYSKGFGIGLAFSKSLVDSMNGHIDVKSEPNVSTSFKVTLPYKNKPDIIDKRNTNDFYELPIDRIETTESKEFDIELPTLLIIDDEIDFRIFLSHAFRKNYNVITAESGEEGLKQLSQHKPQLIICDVMMDGMTGFEVCEKVKSDTETCHIPVILLTALTTDENEIKGIDLGADYYIKKPFSIKQLEIRVQKLIENRKKLKEHFANKSFLPDDSISLSNDERNFLKAVNSVIEQKMDNSSFGVEELAKEVGCSTSHLYRRLKQLTGQIPNAYLRNYRLQKAAELLLSNRDITVAEVMYQIGIESPSYFSAAFKKVYDYSPSEYRTKTK